MILVPFEGFSLAGEMGLMIPVIERISQTWHPWEEIYNGPAPMNRSNFVIPVGESALVYTFEDRTSYLRRTRWYRIWEVSE